VLPKRVAGGMHFLINRTNRQLPEGLILGHAGLRAGSRVGACLTISPLWPAHRTAWSSV